MHPEPRGRVHLANPAADLAVALTDVGSDEVDAADVETDGLRRADGHLAIVRVHDVGEINRRTTRREVARAAQEEDFARRQDRVARDAFGLHQALGLRVELDAREHFLVTDPAPWIRVHDVDELGDGVLSVAHHVAGDALRHGDELATHHEHAVIEACEERLHDHAARMLPCLVEGDAYLGLGLEVERHAPSVVRIQRLDDDGVAEARGRADGPVRAAYEVLARNGQAEIAEDAVRLLFVGGDGDCDVSGLAGDGGLDPLLVLAVPELNQTVVVEPHPRDVARLCGAHERAGGRSELAPLGEVDQLDQLFREIEAWLLRAGHAEVHGTKLGRKQVVDELQREIVRPLRRRAPPRTRRRRSTYPACRRCASCRTRHSRP